MAEQINSKETDRHPNNTRLVKVLRQINRDFLVNAELADPRVVDFTKPKGVEFWAANYNGQQTSRMIIYLRSDVGCSYGQKTGGCLACRHWRIGTAGEKLDINRMYVLQTQAAFEGVEVPAIVNLYNEGNVLNKDEIPEDQLFEIIKLIASKGAKRLVLESRPEFISTPLLQDIKKAAGGMEIEVGIGLESVSETIRNTLFLKGMSLRAYERSVETLRSNNVRTLSYVIIKPPFLTEGEGIEEAISTSRYAFAAGSNVISLEPIGVEPSTITERLYNQGLFQPAKLWSMVHVMNETHSLGEVRLGGTQFAPRPTTLPKNCDLCTDTVVSKLEIYNATYSPRVLTDIACACKETFERDVLSTRAVAREEDIQLRLNKFIHSTFPDATLK